VELAQWSVHAVALLVVALLSSVLTRELQRAGEDLDRSRDELHRVRRLHDRTVESLLSGLLTTDGNGIVTSFNPEAEHITGLAARDAIGASIDAVLPGAREEVMGTPAEAAAGRTRARMPYVNRLGARLHLGLAGSILREVDGTPSGHVVIFQDVTRVAEMERELTRSERLAAVGQLSAAIAHEIRNPLAAISGSIEVLRSGPEGASPESRRLMDIVLRETQRLNALITDFLQYARPGETRRERVELAPCVEDLVKMLDRVRPPTVRAAVSIDPRLVLEADPAQLRQLLWNLCLNAVQAMPDGGELTIGAEAVPTEPSQAIARGGRHGGEGEGTGLVEIVVRDTGAGIPPDVIDRIFDPFFTTKREGSGLGLATVHRIVEGHDGSLRVETAAGVGTAFRVRLPRAGDRS
jgi:two-component system sensor histidine kinase PilS (NtrC family)